ncbi:MAG: hypothetical protein QM737_22765 [Ferruginibacter sp.]
MQHLINAVRLGLQQQNYYSALTLALTLPDMACNIDSNGVGGRKNYMAWIDTYISDKYKQVMPDMDSMDFNNPLSIPMPFPMKEFVFMAAKDIYALRCSYLHEGSDVIKDQDVKPFLDSFIFTVPKAGGNPDHCNYYDTPQGKKLHVQVDIFINDILDGATTWLAAIQNDAAKQTQLNDMMKIYQFQ